MWHESSQTTSRSQWHAAGGRTGRTWTTGKPCRIYSRNGVTCAASYASYASYAIAFTCTNKTIFQQNSMNDDLSGYDPELVWVLTTDVQYLYLIWVSDICSIWHMNRNIKISKRLSKHGSIQRRAWYYLKFWRKWERKNKGSKQTNKQTNTNK